MGVVLVPLVFLAPFLAYAGIAVRELFGRLGEFRRKLCTRGFVGLGSLVVYLVIAIGVPLFLGGLVGSAVQHAFSRFKGRVA